MSIVQKCTRTKYSNENEKLTSIDPFLKVKTLNIVIRDLE